MRINTNRRRALRQLAWFGGLWAVGVLSLACAATVIHWTLPGALHDPATAQAQAAAPR